MGLRDSPQLNGFEFEETETWTDEKNTVDASFVSFNKNNSPKSLEEAKK